VDIGHYASASCTSDDENGHNWVWEVDLRVGSVRREPAPPGPISDLFVRLDDLYSKAGRPSMREIARRAGRGNVSSSTVHNVFSGSRVPTWDYLEKSSPRSGELQAGTSSMLSGMRPGWNRTMGDMSRNAPAEATPSPGRHPERSRRSTGPGTLPGQAGVPSRLSQRIWSNEIPPRNPNFAGRASELEELSRNLDSELSPRVQVISGMGGIGKTELAAEYIHRNIGKYDIVWWIRAEHHDRIRRLIQNS
jgi:hypothetical protein